MSERESVVKHYPDAIIQRWRRPHLGKVWDWYLVVSPSHQAVLGDGWSEDEAWDAAFRASIKWIVTDMEAA